jgi:hypothetical protein
MSKKAGILVERRNSEIYLRPRFTIDLNENHEDIIRKFSTEFGSEKCLFPGTITDGHIFISVAEKEEHFWSPQLHLEILEQTEKTALLKGLFGPKPQVWTLFMFVHFVIGISFLAFSGLLYTRYSLQGAIFFPLAMVITLPLLWILLYFLGKIGKDTGKKQMYDLHEFMIKVIGA